MNRLKECFNVYGYSKTIVTDNNPSFVAQLFERFCAQRDIELMHSPPYHPESNGLADKAVEMISFR